MTTIHEHPSANFYTPSYGADGHDYLSVGEVAALFSVSRVSVWRWIRDGRLPAERLGHRTVRIKREDLEQLLFEVGPGRAHSWSDNEQGIRAQTGHLRVPRAHWRQMGASEHFVQFYDTDAFVLDGVADFIAAGLRAGDATIVVATPGHRQGLEERLRAEGVDPAAAAAGRQYEARDAAETLSRFMVDGSPESGRFMEVIGELVGRVAADERPVRIFGEMVALLVAEGNPAAALRVETLWNDLRQKRPFTLFCAYPMDSFANAAFAELVGEVCAGHSGVIPAESYTALTGAGDRLRAIATLQQKARSLEAEIAERKRLEERLRDENRLIGTLQRLGQTFAAEFDLQKVVQAVTDAATELSGAQFGAFYNVVNVVDEQNESYELYTLSGAPREAFSRFPMPRNTEVFEPTFRGEAVIRLDDVTKDPRFGKNALYRGMPAGHLPVRSYLAVPVVSPSGVVLGGLFFGHHEVGVFTERAERIVIGLAGQAAIAMENARLFAQEKATRAAAEMAEARYRGLFEGTQDAILVLDTEMRFVDANPAASDLLGYTREELLRMRSGDTIVGGQAALRDRLLPDERPGTWRGEYEARRKDGSVVPVEAWGSQVALPTGPIHIAAIRDISERRRAEELRAQLAAIVESTEDAVIGKTLDAVITHWNGGAERLYGYRAEEIIGEPISRLIPPDQPDDLPMIMGRLRRGERVEHYETRRVRKDGQVIDVSVTVSPIRDGEGNIIGASAIARDISGRRTFEREKDEFLATAAHDLKNPLTSVKGVAQMLRRHLKREETPDRERLDEGLAIIDEATTRATGLINDLFNSTRIRMGRPLELKRGPTDLVTLVGRTVAECQHAAGHQAITVETACSALAGEWDEAHLCRVFENLLSNAVKYSPAAGPITVSLSREEDGAGRWAVVRVRDRGIGIPADDLPRVLERFYRAGNVGGIAGSGLGLAGARHIVEQHGGQLSLESVPNEGTTVTVRLPLAPPAVEQAERQAGA